MSRKEQKPDAQNIPSPREFLRARRPELFSDTETIEQPQILRPVFEYYLETLTSRKQEYEFEHFCRKIAEKEICPNLTVQTGPTGGGDGKVDAETYPVAEAVVDGWLTGYKSAGSAPWAFAFSAMEDWKRKLHDDVRKIAGTDRGYELIYFFTNQPVRAKKRAEQQDELHKATGIPVCIVDRNWLAEKTYSKEDNLEIAYATLNIPGASKVGKRRFGPRDTARLNELKELDRQIADPSRYQNARYQLAEDCLHSAMLARGLERDRNEVESRFARAKEFAEQVNFKPQILRVAYERAQTAYYFYEDFADFDRFYNEVEKLVRGTDDANESELLVILWSHSAFMAEKGGG